MSNEDLDLTTTEDLVAALHRRSDAVLVVMVAKMTEDAEDRSLFYRGGLARCVGLARLAEYRLMRSGEGG